MKVYLKIREGKLSKKSIEKGRVKMNSLFLMFHDSLTQKRSYEFLKLYIYDKPKTIIEKDHNRETLQLAESIKAQKVLEFNSRKHGFVSSVSGKIGFLNYFNGLVEKRHEIEGTYGNWYSTLKHLTVFCKGVDIQISKIDETFLENFKDYLLKEEISNNGGKLSQNTALSYFNKVRTALKEAYRNKMISENPMLRIKSIKEKETNREYLTLEELQKLVKTECEVPILKEAFIFSCLTGLRYLALITTSYIDITTNEKIINKKSLQIYSFIFLFIIVAIFGLTFILSPIYSLLLSTVGILIALFIWHLANCDNEKFNDESYSAKMKSGAKETHGKSW